MKTLDTTEGRAGTLMYRNCLEIWKTEISSCEAELVRLQLALPATERTARIRFYSYLVRSLSTSDLNLEKICSSFSEMLVTAENVHGCLWWEQNNYIEFIMRFPREVNNLTLLGQVCFKNNFFSSN